jgi:hypothetical protein
LNITTNLNTEIVLSREFYILSVDIYKNLHLRVENRPEAMQFLNDAYGTYIKLTEQSNLYNKVRRDELLKIDESSTVGSEDEYASSTSSTTSDILIREQNEL